MRRSGMNLRKWIMRRIAVPVLRHLPMASATTFVEGIGCWEFDRIPELRDQILKSVDFAKKRMQADWNVEELSRTISGRLTRWRLRDVLLDGPDKARALNTFDVIGREHLEVAQAEGKGVILLANHFGSHVLPGHWMLREGIDFRFLTERPRHVSKSLDHYFQSSGPLGQTELFISRVKSGNDGVSSIFRSLRILKAGHVLLIASDVRWADNQSVVAEFLGDRWKFTPIWAILAQRCGAPVLPCYCTMLPDGRHRLEFEAPYHVAPGANLQETVQAALKRLEAKVIEDPTNANDYFFWALDRQPATLALKCNDAEIVGSLDSKNTVLTYAGPHVGTSAALKSRTESTTNRD